jgi:phosphatidylglycerophosphate synthase
MTFTGFCLGGAAFISIIFKQYFLGLFFIVLNRFSDGIDGAIARHQGITDRGGFLDIVCDFIFYAGIVFACSIARQDEALWGAFLIFSFIGPMTSFLAYAIIAEKKKYTTAKQGIKSFYYLAGLCEGTETFIVLVLLCLAPAYFKEICLIYGGMCWITTFGRTFQAWKDFSV